jgi:Fe2+ transport system protein FeoA
MIGYRIEIHSQYDGDQTPVNARTAVEIACPNAPNAIEQSLATLHKGDRGVVSRVLLDEAQVGDETGATLVMRLIEIGFVPGEMIEVVAEVKPGGDPIAVRIGGTCFALRRREAEAVLVRLTPAAAGLAS